MTKPVTPDAPLYYAKGLEVWKSPVGTKVEGGTSFTLGFHACTASEVIGEEGAVAIAALLCLGEQAQSPSPETHVQGEPTAWLVRDGFYRDQVFLDRQKAQNRAEERSMEGLTSIIPLYEPKTRNQMLPPAVTGQTEIDPGVAAADMGVNAECAECHGTGEVFGHADDCHDDLCALNGDIHSCNGHVQPCGCAAPKPHLNVKDHTKLDGPELWELTFGILEGDVPEQMTDEVFTKMAEAINNVFVDPLQLAGKFPSPETRLSGAALRAQYEKDITRIIDEWEQRREVCLADPEAKARFLILRSFDLSLATAPEASDA